jgi:DNA-binding CsgD family transcriptional regulator/tetratricopeptide (TPR) repeat protein
VVELLEREGVLGPLSEYAAEARSGTARVVLVGGEAGVGKTSLLGELRRRLPDARWLWGACDGSFTPRPLGPVTDVAAAVGGALARACAVDAPRDRIFRALLDDLSDYDGFTVLCIEDAHWADEATLDLLHFLAPRLREASVLLLVTYRDDGLATDHPLRITLGEFATERAVRRVHLPPLSRAAVARLAHEAGIEADELFNLTGGNPFLVTEVVESGTAEVPSSVREAVLARVARLTPDARRVIEAAALIGSRIEPGVLTAVAAVDAAVVDDCLTVGALISEATHFRFRHEIARMALEQALPVHRRVELHRRILDVLFAAGLREDARLAHHAEGAGDGAAVLQFAPRAAEQAAELGAHREAAAQYERARRFAYAADPTVRAQLHDALAAIDAVIDRWEQAAEVGEQALAEWRQLGNQVRIGDALRRLSVANWRLCRGEESERLLAEALAVLEPLPLTNELGWAYAQRAFQLMGRDDDEALRMTRRVQALASELGDDALTAHSLNTQACLVANTGTGDYAPLFRRSIEFGLNAGYAEGVGRGFANLHTCLANDYRLAEAESVFYEATTLCDEEELGTHMHCLRGGHAWVLERIGRWDEAEELTAKELNRPDLSLVSRISPLVARGVIHARRGKPDGQSLLAEADDLAVSAGDPVLAAEVGLARLEAAWLARDEVGMRVEAERLAEVVARTDPWTRGSISVWLRRCGFPDPGVGVVTPPYQLMLAGQYRAAADEWLRLNCPYDSGLALIDSDQHDDLLEALRLFERTGATSTVAMVQARMRDLGMTAIPRGVRAGTRSNRFGLTRREQEVLELVCENLTNAEIGVRLFISERTVDSHVSAVLMKLGVDSRRKAARLVAETGAGREPATATAP